MIIQALRDSILYAATAAVARGMGLLMLPFYTRWMSQADYGGLEMIVLMGSFVSLLGALEIQQAMARFIPEAIGRGDHAAYALTGLVFTLGCLAAVFLVLQLAAPELSHMLLRRDGQTGVFRLGVVLAVLLHLAQLVQNQLRWELRGRDYVANSMMVAFGTAAMTAILHSRTDDPLTGILTGMCIAALAGVLHGLWCLRDSYRARIDLAKLREMLIFCLPLVLSSAAIFVNFAIDRVVIGRLVSVEAVAHYGAAYRIAAISMLAVLGFQSAISPLVYKYHSLPKTPAHIEMLFRTFVAVAIILVAVVSVFRDELMMIFAAAPYRDAAVLIPILAPALMLSQVHIFAPGLALSKRTERIAAINFAAAVINLSLSLVLTARYGTMGAAIALLVASCVMAVAFITLGQRHYAVPYRFARIFAACAGASVAIAIPALVHPAEPLALLVDAASLLLIVAAILVSRLVEPSEVWLAVNEFRLRMARG